MSPSEQEARQQIDALLAACGWRVQDASAANIHAGRGVAIREFPLAQGYGFADYLPSRGGNWCSRPRGCAP